MQADPRLILSWISSSIFSSLSRVALALGLGLGLGWTLCFPLSIPQAFAGANLESSKDILPLLQTKIELTKKRGKNPVVIFDLDDTLFSSGSRTLQIFDKIASRPDFRKKYPSESRQLLETSLEDLEWSPKIVGQNQDSKSKRQARDLGILAQALFF